MRELRASPGIEPRMPIRLGWDSVSQTFTVAQTAGALRLASAVAGAVAAITAMMARALRMSLEEQTKQAAVADLGCDALSPRP
jgi:hypothetical protein